MLMQHIFQMLKRRQLLAPLVFIICGLVSISIVFYIQNRSPKFSGSTPNSIDISIRTPFSEDDGSKLVIETSITKLPACKLLFDLLRRARVSKEHKCLHIGSISIHFPDGQTDRLEVLPGHDTSRYEFRFGGRMYSLPREELYHALQAGGVDTSKMPETEH